jgi:hypothetical protein
MNDRTRQEGSLIVLLRLCGVVTLLAFPTMLLPADWMASTHRWLGLGEFPATPLVDYLTRSLSAMYGFHGGLMLLVSLNVRRYASMVTYLAVMYVLLGLLLLAVDIHAGLPLPWILGEGPLISAVGLLMLYLHRFVPAD